MYKFKMILKFTKMMNSMKKDAEQYSMESSKVLRVLVITMTTKPPKLNLPLLLVIWLKACTGYFFHTKLLMVSFLSRDDKSIGANEQTLLEESESWESKPSWSGTQSSLHWKLCQNLDLQRLRLQFVESDSSNLFALIVNHLGTIRVFHFAMNIWNGIVRLNYNGSTWGAK